MIARVAVGAVLVLVAIVLRRPIEALPLTHVLVQLPMLALAGAVLAPVLPLGRGEWNRGGWACLIVAGTGIAFWMLPRSIDAALSNPLWETGKILSLPLIIGLPLRLGWARAHPLLRGVLKAQALSMLGVLAFLYTHAPVRLCNAYLVEDQQRLGLGFLALALVLAVAWVAPLISPRAAPRASRTPREIMA